MSEARIESTPWLPVPSLGGYFRIEQVSSAGHKSLVFAPFTPDGGIDVESACDVDMARIPENDRQNCLEVQSYLEVTFGPLRDLFTGNAFNDTEVRVKSPLAWAGISSSTVQ
jgi:hypothetical protein